MGLDEDGGVGFEEDGGVIFDEDAGVTFEVDFNVEEEHFVLDLDVGFTVDVNEEEHFVLDLDVGFAEDLVEDVHFVVDNVGFGLYPKDDEQRVLEICSLTGSGRARAEPKSVYARSCVESNMAAMQEGPDYSTKRSSMLFVFRYTTKRTELNVEGIRLNIHLRLFVIEAGS